MKRVMLGFSVVAVLAALVIFTPGIIGNGRSSDGGRIATGPMWQAPTQSPTGSTQPRQADRMPAQTPASDPAQAIKKRQDEIAKLTRMYAKNGMTPEVVKRIQKLRKSQAVPPAMTPDAMKKLMQQRMAMQKTGALPPMPTKRPIVIRTKDPVRRSPVDERFGVVLGRITAREKIALTPDALLSVRLLDITKPDAPRIIAEQGVASPGQMPCSFLVCYNKQSVNPKRKYAVQAIVADRGAVRWKSTAECKQVGQGQPVALEIPLQPYKEPEPSAPSIQIGDTPVTLDAGKKPVLADGEWLLPVNPILKAAGIEFAYSETDKVLTVSDGDVSLKTKLPGRTVVLGDGTKRDLAEALEIRDGSIYAPIEFLQIATHRKALYDRESNTIVLVRM